MTTTVFDDTLSALWQNRSWGTEVDLDGRQTVAEGNSAIEASHQAAWAALYLTLPEGELTEPADELSFSIHGGAADGKAIRVFVVNELGDWLEGPLLEPAANGWSNVSFEFDGPTQVQGLVWQEQTGSPQGAFFLDEIELNSADPNSSPRGGDLSPTGDFSVTSIVYDDGFAEPWQNWSWDSSVDTANSVRVRAGDLAISAKYNQPWAGLYIGSNSDVPVGSADEVRFSINGGVGGQQVRFSVVNRDGTHLPGGVFTLSNDGWADVRVSLAELGNPSRISGFIWQDLIGRGNQSSFFVDEVYLTETGEAQDPGGNDSGPTITIDPSVIIREISDDIYGLNFADETLAEEIDLPVDRWGGNATSRYNYQIDATNVGSDWFFENHPSDDGDPNSLPNDSSANRFIEKDTRVGADTILTVGMTGWAASGRGITGAFSVDKYGPQQEVDPWRAYGNGVKLDGSYVTGNDPFDTSFETDAEFTRGWVEHLVSQHGTADEGGVQYYALDNEPMLWHHTHRDVHPEEAGYDEVLEKGIAHARAIKAVDPSADVLGPTVFGWSAYFYSALDGAAGGAWWENPQDQIAHGRMPFVPWYLQEMAAAETETGERLLDYLDIHYYPQNEGVPLTDGPGNAATQQARLEATRSLWDPSYVDPTWINDNVRLIPRMRDWIDTYYPGTKLAISEYNFGATEHINGAVTQADVLGIFGREGVDLATMWDPPDADDAVSYAFRMYRNYDGEGSDGSRFGETSILATTGDANKVSVFAAQRDADDAVTVMLINKSSNASVTPILLPAEYDGLPAEVYTYDSSNLAAIERGSDVVLDVAAGFQMILPGSSITLLELPTTVVLQQELSVSVVSLDAAGRPDELSSVAATFDGVAEDASLSITLNSIAIDVSKAATAWDFATGQKTWDLSSLNLNPGRYEITVSTDDGSLNTSRLVAYRGDANLDGKVQFDDFLAILGGFQEPANDWGDGDFDGDGMLTFGDFLFLADNFGKSVDSVFLE